MREIIDSHIQKTQKFVLETSGDKAGEDSIDLDGAVSELKKGLRVLFMRPDTDGLRDSLLAPLEVEINTYRPFIEVLEEIVKESLLILKKKKKNSVISQAGALYIIENAMSHVRGIKKIEADAIFSNVGKSKIKLSKKLLSYLRLNEGRGQTASPSHIARKILKQRLKKRAVEKKKAEVAKKKAEAAKKKAEATKKKAEAAKKKAVNKNNNPKK